MANFHIVTWVIFATFGAYMVTSLPFDDYNDFKQIMKFLSKPRILDRHRFTNEVSIGGGTPFGTPRAFPAASASFGYTTRSGQFWDICDAARMNTGVNRQAEGRHSARQTNR